VVHVPSAQRANECRNYGSRLALRLAGTTRKETLPPCSSKQIGRWGCRQLNIHNARLLSEGAMDARKGFPFFSDRTRTRAMKPEPEKYFQVVALSSREPVPTSLENAP